MTITLIADAPDPRFEETFPCLGVDDETINRPLRAMSADDVLNSLNLCRWEVEEIEVLLDDDQPPPEPVSAEWLRGKVDLVERLAEALPRYTRLTTAVVSTIPPALCRILTMDDAVRRAWPGGRPS